VPQGTNGLRFQATYQLNMIPIVHVLTTAGSGMLAVVGCSTDNDDPSAKAVSEDMGDATDSNGLRPLTSFTDPSLVDWSARIGRFCS
jgi:hypothetical protein